MYLREGTCMGPPVTRSVGPRQEPTKAVEEGAEREDVAPHLPSEGGGVDVGPRSLVSDVVRLPMHPEGCPTPSDSKEPQGQMAQWLLQLQEYNLQIKYRAGQMHANADVLSRQPMVCPETRAKEACPCFTGGAANRWRSPWGALRLILLCQPQPEEGSQPVKHLMGTLHVARGCAYQQGEAAHQQQEQGARLRVEPPFYSVGSKVTPEGRRSLCHGNRYRRWGLAELSRHPRDQRREPGGSRGLLGATCSTSMFLKEGISVGGPVTQSAGARREPTDMVE
ncbi:unnamed protein product [Lampetra fluviatilis]